VVVRADQRRGGSPFPATWSTCRSSSRCTPTRGQRGAGAALSDLFWYWLSPGAEVHRSTSSGDPYDEVARCRRICRCRAWRRASRRRVRARCVAGPNRSRPATRPGDAGLGGSTTGWSSATSTGDVRQLIVDNRRCLPPSSAAVCGIWTAGCG
jgi:hypothetical protein